MTDHFQLTTLIAAAIRECRLETSGQQGNADPGNVEEAQCIAKAVLAAITEAGFEISVKPAAS